MANNHGDFIWYELMTSDADGASVFYSSILGWTIANPGNDGFDYREIQVGDAYVGGLLALSPEMISGGAKPGWIGYIKVDDVDAAVASVEAAGGRLYLPARDMPGVGRFAMVADPQGAPFYVMKGASDDTSHAFAALEPKLGHCAWNELATTDPEAAKAFYGAQFGWAKDGEMDMGPMGKYEFLRSSGGRFSIGAVMPKMPEMPVSCWTHYFRVADIDCAAPTIAANGGTVLHGPSEVPGGDWIINGMDPQGAMFALVGQKE